jgi:hypothetical protein
MPDQPHAKASAAPAASFKSASVYRSSRVPRTKSGYGLVIVMAVPGADDIMLYEPKHPLAYSL